MIHKGSKEATETILKKAPGTLFPVAIRPKRQLKGTAPSQKIENKNEVINLREVATFILSFESNLTLNLLLLVCCLSTVKLI